MAQEQTQASLPASVGDTTATIKSATSAGASDINSGAATLYSLDIDCTSNTTEDVYVPLYDVAAPTVGTTDPYMLLKGKKGLVTSYLFRRGILFGTALSLAVVTERGGMGTTSPTGTVDLKLLYS